MLASFFFATYSVYGLNKLTDFEEDIINNPEREKTIKKISKIFEISLVLSFILSLVIGFSTNILTLPALLFPLLMGVVYSVRILPHVPRLKDVTGVKNLIIALSWSVSLTLLPVIGLSIIEPKPIILVGYISFVKSFINSILFDVRDIEGDRINLIKTIPVLIGINKTKKILLIMNSTLIPWLIFAYYFFSKYFFVLFFIIIYGYWYILYFCRDGKKIGKSLDLLVDGEFILAVILALIFV
ncbi:Digeranylgeranylglyceryl phosphate synthase [uncultured archaeon]|nr:Digeranylgeranylglyceryl phosphate synthase [uncultured archaeon]